ncbi:DUF2130 domain-containing protein [Pelagibacterales bacterium SAG-MED46]|nr:DUF2130 domain-containing protein [Pelagibacterales bacterium SAG-MED46]
MSQLKIICPNCNETFSADEALQKHLKEKEKIYQEEIKVKEKLLKEKYNLDFKIKEKNLEKELSLKIQEQNKSKFQNLVSKLDEAEEEKKNIEIKYQENIKKKEKLLESKFKKKNESELKKSEDLRAKERKEDEIFKKRQKIKIEELTRQLKQKSVEVQGEVQEELIEDYLRDKFPNDTVEEVKKGAKGADCILTINNKDNEKLAQIYFESKDHKSFKEEWVSKLLSDMKDKNINYGVLITTAMPKDYNKDLDGYVERHGKRILIIPMNYQIIHTLVSFIRVNLINEYKSKKDFNAPKMMKRLWDHIMGPSFQLPVRNLYQSMIKMNDLMGKEKKFFENNMANKERAMLDMEEDFRDMIKSFTLKVGPDCVIQIEDNK